VKKQQHNVLTFTGGNKMPPASGFYIKLYNDFRYCCDFRPYFTIHDSEFKEYTSKTKQP